MSSATGNTTGVAPGATRSEPRTPVGRPVGAALVAALTGLALVTGTLWVLSRPGPSGDRPADEGRPTAGAVARIIAVEPAAAQARVADLRAQAPATQQDALADGHVTMTEYRAAVEATVSCLDTGFAALAASPGGPTAVLTMEPIAVSADSFDVTYSYGIAAVTGAGQAPPHDAVTALEERCHRDTQQQVKDVYQIRALADPAYVARVAGEFAACAGAAGAPSFGSTPADMVAALQRLNPGQRDRLRPCFDRSPAVSIGLGSKVRHDR